MSRAELGVARTVRRVVGFLVASPVPLRDGWLIEQTVRGHAASNGTGEPPPRRAWLRRPVGGVET